MCLEQEHKPKSKNTKLKSKNHKPKNINLATYIPCQPNTKTTNTNPNQTIVRNGYKELTIVDFFKFVFSEDLDQPQNDDAPEPNLDPNLNPDSNLDSTATWSFGRLIKMIASKLESLI